MKKAVSVLFALVLVLSLFSCGQKTNASPPEASLDAQASSGDAQASPDDAPESPAGAPASAADAPRYGGIARLVYPAEGANPIGVPWKIGATDSWLLLPYGEALLVQYADGSMHPWLAESFEVDAAKSEIRLKIRQDVTFHDGSPLNAESAKWNLETARDKGTSKASYDSVTILGPFEIAVHFPDGITNLTTAALATKSFCLISMEAYQKNGEEWALENPVGTGPFTFVEYVKGAYAKFAKFDGYWQKGKPYLDGIEIHMIRDVMTQNIALQATGDQSIDFLNTSSGDQIKMFRDMGYNIQSQGLGPIVLLPSSADPSSPFAKLEVRLALSYAINRDAICVARGFGVWKPAYQIIAEGYGGYSDDPNFGVPRYDPAKAKELLAQAGYPNGFTTTLYGQTGLADKDAVVAVQAQLAEIGITAEVNFPDAGGYADLRGNGWDGILVQSNRSLPTMETSFKLLYDKERAYFKSMQYTQEAQDLLVKAYEKLGDNTAELQAFQKYLLDNAYAVPLYSLYDSYILKPNLKGYDIKFGLSITDLWLSK